MREPIRAGVPESKYRQEQAVHVWSGVDEVPGGFGPSVVTIGNFDGVHGGHQKVLARVVERARAANARSVVVTFDPHPSLVHRPESAPDLLTGLTERVELISKSGVDAVLVLPYSLEFAHQSPEEFVTRYVTGTLRAEQVVVGLDVHFGWQNSGDLTTMIELGTLHGFTVEPITDLGLVGTGNHSQGRWSSTAVRDLLTHGQISEANEILGREHAVRGTVVHGNARGRDLGFPTANLSVPVDGFVPADGVYAGWLERPTMQGAPAMPAAISVGTNPTFDGTERRVEAYVLDRTDLDLYHEQVRLRFVQLLRPTVRFDSVEELVTQMGRDVDSARQILS